MTESAASWPDHVPDVRVGGSPALRWLTAVLAWCCLALGVSVLAGWFLHVETLIQVVPGFAPMQFNTGLGFVLCAVSTLLAARGQRRWGMGCGVAATVLGGLTLVEYIAGGDLGIDQLFMKAYITDATSHPGRMAPNTALCFVLAGTACTLQAIRHEFRAWVLAAGILSATTFGMATDALIGYATGNEGSYGWGNLTRMAIHTATGFMLLSAGSLVWVLRWIRGTADRNPGLLIAVAAVMGGIFILDIFLPLGMIAGVLYVIPLLISLQGKDDREVFTVAIGATALTTIAFFESPAGVTPIAIVIANRLVSIGIIWVAAVLGLRMKRAEAQLRTAHDDLERRVERRTADLALRTVELEDTNRALADLNQRLDRSNQDLESFAYIASHDLQEPLRVITGYVQLLERRYRGSLDSDADDFIRYAVEGAERMRTLIDELLRYSRVDSRGKQLQPTDPNTVLDEVLAGLEAAIDESACEVVHGTLPSVMADPVQLRQLLQNLIANSIKFHGEAPPRVEIGAERAGESWRFNVRDNGMGFDPKYSERVFKVFQRLNKREEFPGTGIGLAICRKIVLRHGGEIGIDSQPGVGTTVWFTLPATVREEGVRA